MESTTVPSLAQHLQQDPAAHGIRTAGTANRRGPFAGRWVNEGSHELAVSDPRRVSVVYFEEGPKSGFDLITCGRHHRAGARQMLIVPPSANATWCSPDTVEYLQLCIPPAFLDRALLLKSLLLASRRHPALAKIADGLSAALRDSDTVDDEELDAWLTVLSKRIERHCGQGFFGAEIHEAIGLIEAQLPERPKVAMLAKSLGKSVTAFSQTFRDQTGMSPHQFILTKRLQRTRDLLVNSGKTLSEIAHAVGFASQSHMTTTFRREIGVTPMVFRRRFGRRH